MQNALEIANLRRIIAIIPARGGSKEIPRKNLRLLAGVPLLVHTIRHAQQATLVQRVIVSTEDHDIAKIAQSAGAELVIRPLALATEESPSELALLQVLEQLERNENYYTDVIVFLQCTSPIRACNDIDRAIEKFLNAHADTLFSACRSHSLLWSSQKEELRPINYDFHNRRRRQDMPVQFEENGSIYVMRSEILKKNKNRLGGRIALYEMSPFCSFQIDTEDSWKIVEQLFLNRQ